MMQKIKPGTNHLSVVGCTGSLGQSVCDTAERLGFCITALAGWNNQIELARMIYRFRPGLASCEDHPGPEVRAAAHAVQNCCLVLGPDGLMAAASDPHADLVAVTIGGWAGLRPALAALESHHFLLMGCKEALVGAGPLLSTKALQADVPIVPLDSEIAAALYLANRAGGIDAVEELVLTGSGGPLRGLDTRQRATAPVERVLKHPVWPMGKKISVDSATLINKAFEIVEAGLLFGLKASAIRVCFDPSARLHAAVRMRDGQTLALLADPTMDVPVCLSLAHPEAAHFSVLSDTAAQDAIKALRSPEPEESRVLALGFQALDRGGLAPLAMVISDEVAVDAYLADRISLSDVVDRVSAGLDACPTGVLPATFEGIDGMAANFRRQAQRILPTHSGGDR